MFDAASVETYKQIGLSTGGLGVLAYILWQVWTKVRQQLKEDSKGQKIDDRIDSYTEKLQKTADNLITRLDTLQTQNNDLVFKSAQLSAQLAIAQSEAADLKTEVADHISRIKYLEELLMTKGISYVK